MKKHHHQQRPPRAEAGDPKDRGNQNAAKSGRGSAGTSESPEGILRTRYVVAVVWVLVAMALGYWAGKYGFSLPPASSSASQEAVSEDAAIRTFITRYFSTWSARDMDGYGSCFQTNATILFVDGETGTPYVLDRETFLESQRNAHARATSPMKEVPEGIYIQQHGNLAHVQVRWMLTKEGKEERGWDYFSLLKVGGEWKITHLSFFNDQ